MNIADTVLGQPRKAKLGPNPITFKSIRELSTTTSILGLQSSFKAPVSGIYLISFHSSQTIDKFAVTQYSSNGKVYAYDYAGGKVCPRAVHSASRPMFVWLKKKRGLDITVTGAKLTNREETSISGILIYEMPMRPAGSDAAGPKGQTPKKKPFPKKGNNNKTKNNRTKNKKKNSKKGKF